MTLSRPVLLAVAGGLSAMVALAGAPSTAAVLTTRSAGPTCAPGSVQERDTDLAAFAAGTRAACVPALRPESFKDLALANGQRLSQSQAPYGVQPGAFAAGAAQAARLASAGAATSSSWTPLGKTPLIGNGQPYGEVNQQGFVNLSGRIEDFSYVPGQAGHWFAAVANGGIHETTDAGQHWRSIGDTLPTQITGTVAYDAGRVLVGTGDPAFGGNSLAGLGAFYSDDHGAHWTHATGVPSGSLFFQLAVDPNNPAIVYLASSKGLYRSTDRGASYRNEVLPTTCTQLDDLNCFFANIVTDVVVQAKGGAGQAKGGAVLAAVSDSAGNAGLSPVLISPVGSPLQTPQTRQFQVVGRYYGGNSCFGLKATLPVPCVTNVQHTGSTSTHPDQHAGLFVPDPDGKGVTLLVGNDGGAYAQHTSGTGIPTQAGWGDGAQGTGTGILHTLLPYQASMAKDGTVYAGLQDNGELKITPDGTQYEVYGGDGFYSAVDPDNSKTAYEEYTNGAVSVTTDGGSTWTSIDPNLTASLFATPFVMDPRTARHLLIGGRDIEETAAGPLTNNSSDGITTDPATAWTKVFDLGTRLHPGEAAATADTTDPNKASANNSLSAVDLFGATAYVGFCGACDIVTGTRPFHSGLATNVGRSKAPKPLTTDGWHIARAIGLPQRYIQGVTVDHADSKTVYAAIGGYGRRWIPPGALNDDTSKVGTGHLFVSHDAGDHFTDISGNLPDLPANAVLVRGTTLLVATDNGVYTTAKDSPGTYAVLAHGLPTAPVLSLQNSPRNTAEIVAASYGRGVYTVLLPEAVGGPMNTPSQATPQTGSLGSSPLPATGLSATLAALALLLLGCGFVLRRRTA